jgi:hypothetical protein
MAIKKLYVAYVIIAILSTIIAATSLPGRFEPTHIIVRQVNCISCHAEEFNDLKIGFHIKPMGLAQNRTLYDYASLYANASDPVYKAMVAPCYTCHVTYENYNLFGLTDPYVFYSGQNNQTIGNMTIANAVYDAQYGSMVEWPYSNGNMVEEINNASNATIAVQLQLLSIQPADASLNSDIMLQFANYSGQQGGNTSYQPPTQTLSQNQTLQTLTVDNMTNDYFNITLIFDESQDFNNATLSLSLDGTDKGIEVFVINVNGTYHCNAACAIYSIPKDLTAVNYFKTNGAYKTVRLDAVWNAWRSYPVNGNITSSDTMQTSSPNGWISANTCSSRDGMCHINQEATSIGMSDGIDPERSLYPHYMEFVTTKQCKICHLDIGGHDSPLTGASPTTIHTSTSMPSENGTIEGNITDASTGGAAISGATVTAGGVTSSSDTNGSYSVSLEPGTYDVIASATGYLNNTITGVVVASNNVTTQDFTLIPAPEPTPTPSAALTLSSTSASTGKTYYVAKTGNDNNPGTITQPWLTISKAASTMVAGDTVFIKRGTYSEYVSITKSGSPGNYITYSAYPGDENLAIIDGSTLTSTWWDDEGLIAIKASYINITGLRVTNSKLAGITAFGPNTDITLRNNIVSHTSTQCISFDGDEYTHDIKNVTIIGNYVSDCVNGNNPGIKFGEFLTVQGVDTFEVAGNIVCCSTVDGTGGGEGIDVPGGINGAIHHNIVHDLSRLLIYVSTDAGGITNNIDVYDNLVYNGSFSSQCEVSWGCSGIVVVPEGGTVSNVNVYNNIVYNTLRSLDVVSSSNVNINSNTLRNQIYISSSTGVVIRNTVGTSINDGSGSTKDHNWLTDTQGSAGFVNEAGHDYHLQSSSPLINAGTAIGAPAFDFDGIPRPQGAGYDIGAFEYTP